MTRVSRRWLTWLLQGKPTMPVPRPWSGVTGGGGLVGCEWIQGWLPRRQRTGFTVLHPMFYKSTRRFTDCFLYLGFRCVCHFPLKKKGPPSTPVGCTLRGLLERIAKNTVSHVPWQSWFVSLESDAEGCSVSDCVWVVDDDDVDDDEYDDAVTVQLWLLMLVQTRIWYVAFFYT